MNVNNFGQNESNLSEKPNQSETPNLSEKSNPSLLKVNHYLLIDVTCPHCRQVRKEELSTMTCNECFIDYDTKKYLKFRENLYFEAKMCQIS